MLPLYKQDTFLKGLFNQDWARTHKRELIAVFFFVFLLSFLPLGAWYRTVVLALASVVLFDAVRHRKPSRGYLPHIQLLLLSSLCFTIVGLLVYMNETNTEVRGFLAKFPHFLQSPHFHAYTIAMILMLNIEKIMEANIDDTFVLGVFYIIGALMRL